MIRVTDHQLLGAINDTATSVPAEERTRLVDVMTDLIGQDQNSVARAALMAQFGISLVDTALRNESVSES